MSELKPCPLCEKSEMLCTCDSDDLEKYYLVQERDALRARVAELELGLHKMAVACNIVWGEQCLVGDEQEIVDDAWATFHKLLPEMPKEAK